ncbi:hypothetical protein ETB97_005242 [Aspergillus alliaceus]|uniref:Uncharacterized protein n=1 Tax=Petromyces alliaceus TaxID=209559 RepID=A0A5N6G507_PETAA|nr:uncharacterized protein BDW43DRAFT_308960 [Aspergillus alliaceus]KAB8235623.1 hypothetical protein BDW43DRAFT_308960 [Aspergillus alliaceus]KAF5857830.1 hypothetical protein ETB97_005242 [Aspergillus burnettii]
MRFTTVLLVGLASMVAAHPSASPEEGAAANNCGYPNGNCYDNNCHGELSGDRITCTSVVSVDMDVAAMSDHAMKTAAMVATVAALTTILAALAVEKVYMEERQKSQDIISFFSFTQSWRTSH